MINVSEVKSNFRHQPLFYLDAACCKTPPLAAISSQTRPDWSCSGNPPPSSSCRWSSGPSTSGRARTARWCSTQPPKGAFTYMTSAEWVHLDYLPTPFIACHIDSLTQPPLYPMSYWVIHATSLTPSHFPCFTESFTQPLHGIRGREGGSNFWNSWLKSAWLIVVESEWLFV